MHIAPWFVAYAPFDLKNADVFVQDGTGMTEAGGSEESPTVKNNPSLSDTTLDVLSMNKKVPLGARFTVPGSDLEYTISGRTLASSNADEVQTLTITASGGDYKLSFKGVQTGTIAYNANAAAIQSALEALSSIGAGNVAVTSTGPFTITFQADLANLSLPLLVLDTTGLTGGSATIAQSTQGTANGKTLLSMVFTPGLDVDLAGGEAITFLPVRLAIKIGEGDVTFDEKRELQYFRDRGRLDTVRDGDEQPMEASFDATWEFIKSLPGSTTPTWKEAMLGTGPAADWHSSSDDPCEPYAVDIVIVQSPDSDCGGTLGRETITLEDFRWTDMGHKAKDGQISVKGSCNRTQALVERVLL